MYNGEGVFLLLGQDPAISQLAGEYSAAMCFCFPMVFLADIYYEFLINVDGFFFEMQCVQLVGNIQHVVMVGRDKIEKT